MVMESLAELQRQRRTITHGHIWDNAMTRGDRPRPPDTSELDAKIAEAMEREGKMHWQRTSKQVWSAERMPQVRHRRYVEEALRAGKPVPAHVLHEYPALEKLANEL